MPESATAALAPEGAVMRRAQARLPPPVLARVRVRVSEEPTRRVTSRRSGVMARAGENETSKALLTPLAVDDVAVMRTAVSAWVNVSGPVQTPPTRGKAVAGVRFTGPLAPAAPRVMEPV